MRGRQAERTPMVGDVFTRLTVTGLPPTGGSRLSKDRWTCHCSCPQGTVLSVLGKNLLYGKVKSCGCLQKENQRAVNDQHRLRHSALVSWRTMLRREDAAIDPAWREAFENFFVCLGSRPQGTVLSRHDFDGAYEPSNCFWELRREQVERIRARRWSLSLSVQDSSTKRCSKCLQEKSFSDFYVNTASKTKLHSACKARLSLKARRLYPKHLIRILLGAARSRALNKGLEFELTLKDLEPLPTHCPVFGFELTRGEDRDTSFSLDRKDNAKGYVRGNVEVISHLANRLKSNATASQLEQVVTWMRGNSLAESTVGLTAGLL